MKLSELKKGQRFKFSARGATWKVICTSLDQRTGWYPEQWIQIKNEKTGTWRTPYEKGKTYNKDVILVAR